MGHTNHQSLAALHHIHTLTQQLFENVSEPDAYHHYHPELASLAWLFGRIVYVELRLIREVIQQDATLVDPVRHLFDNPERVTQASSNALPPRDHLINWALEIFDRHMTQLANPGQLPEHPLLLNHWVIDWLVQHHCELYEKMLNVLQQRALETQQTDTFEVDSPLLAATPQVDAYEAIQAHYRIGAKEGVVFDRETPAQIVELHNFRICRKPVCNSEYLASLQAGATTPPVSWRTDCHNNWFAIGLNGPAALIADEPVSGVSQKQALAYTQWVEKLDGFTGAVLQHEYQWEVCARQGKLEQTGRVWEWCSNSAASYEAYRQPALKELCSVFLDSDTDFILRGASLHTQNAIRRASYRTAAKADANYLFSGFRLVLPPESSQ